MHNKYCGHCSHNLLMSDKETAGGKGCALTATQRARIERNRLRARALQDSRLVQSPHNVCSEPQVSAWPALDTGGGFLLEDDEGETASRVVRVVAPPAPLVLPGEQPRCVECACLFPQSYLFDAFDHRVCDKCRDDGEKHALITRTEAKSEYLLKDCDLDSRPPPLRCVRRRNPHSSRYGDMRLYLRLQVEERALEVWGSETRIEEERYKRQEGRAKLKEARTHKRLRALRMDVRSSLFDRSHAAHEHAFGPERRHADSNVDVDADTYSRECRTCGYIETYEKM